MFDVQILVFIVFCVGGSKGTGADSGFWEGGLNTEVDF